MFAVTQALKDGLFARDHWLNNIISGLIVGIVALPLGMAFAIASGAKPEQGIYTSIIAGFCTAVFGGSRLQISGPTGAFIVVLSGITAKYGIEGLQIATLMAGVILLAFGLTRMGAIIKYIPSPVIVGFTAGIAVIIWVGQWQDFFGLPEVSGAHFHLKLIHLIQVFPQFHITTALLACFALILVLYSSKILGCKRIPGPLIALLVVSVIQFIFQFEGVKTIGSAFGGIPQGLPEFKVPSLSWIKMIDLIGPAFTIAMLGAIESLLSAVVADGMAGTRHNSNQELIGQGIANIAAPLFGGFAATGAIARTATNIRNGATSPLSGIMHSITLLVILLVLAPFAIHIPLAVLSAILFVVAWNMSEAKRFINMLKRAPKSDIAILLITFGLTVFADLVVAVNIGVILATLLFLRRMAGSVEIKRIAQSDLLARMGIETLPEELLVFTVDGPFFFGAVENFDRALSGSQTYPKYLIIRLKWVPFIDMTGIQSLENVVGNLHKQGVTVMLSGANHSVSQKLHRGGIAQLVGEHNMFKQFDEALNAAQSKLLNTENSQ